MLVGVCPRYVDTVHPGVMDREPYTGGRPALAGRVLDGADRRLRVYPGILDDQMSCTYAAAVPVVRRSHAELLRLRMSMALSDQ